MASPRFPVPREAVTIIPKGGGVMAGYQSNEALKKLGVLFVTISAAALFMTLPGSRLHWPAMAANYLIVLLLYFWYAARDTSLSDRGLWDYMFPAHIWSHRSSLNDGIFAFMLFGLMISLFNWGIFTPKYFVGLAMSLSSLLPPATAGEKPGLLVMAYFTLQSIIFAEFFYYWLHRLSHAVPAMWAFHKVHHSAKVMTPLAVYRLHPVDFWLTSATKGFGYGLNLVIFMHFYPSKEAAITFLGANAVMFFLSIFGGVLHHSHVWISFGPVLERFIISPAQHQVHHSENPQHYNKNFSSMLSLWDWVFGSLYVTGWKDEKITLGLGGEKAEAPYQNALSMLLHPFRENAQLAAKRIRKRRKA